MRPASQTDQLGRDESKLATGHDLRCLLASLHRDR